MKVHFLDVGKTRYGDCILIEHDGTTILVDGAHPGDEKEKEGLPRTIPEQLDSLLGSERPHRISLLIVTHCHLDHIGCLPAMFARHIVTFEDALVADEALGFGGVSDVFDVDSWREDSSSDVVRRVVAGLREEPRSVNETDDELMAFLEAADNLQSSYRDLLSGLEAVGTNVIRYTGQDVSEIERKYAAVGLQVLGPTADHLEICARAIARYQRDAQDIVAGLVSDAPDRGPVELYRSALLSGLSDAEDRPGKGAALNDQSIVFMLNVRNTKALLVGDMQFAKPEVSNLGDLMEGLRGKISAAGPYVLIKTAHHTSYNGLDDSVLHEYEGNPLLVHSGGWDDGGHPDATALHALHTARHIAGFARTDHNGLISCDLSGERPQVLIERGDLNDFTTNSEDPIRAEAPSGSPSPAVVSSAQVGTAPATTAMPIVRQAESVAQSSGSGDAGIVEVVTRIPHKTTRVTVTIDIQPHGESAPARVSDPTPSAQPVRPASGPAAAFSALGGGRSLPQLLFATSRSALSRKIGNNATAEIIDGLRQQGKTVLDSIPDHQFAATTALAAVKEALRSKQFGGVVLLGGYDVVPAVRLDAVDPQLRAQLSKRTGDSDEFIVWSDAEYGDQDGDDLPEIPVSRVPDAGSAGFMRMVLSASAKTTSRDAFGIRNRERPFADGVFNLFGNSRPLLRSEPASPNDVRPEMFGGHSYFMLHGSDRDTSRFWGEDDEGACEAINVHNIPTTVGGIVFTGCCWGALIVQIPALYQRPDTEALPRDIRDSMALSFLAAGAPAFVGCTGSHYSPTVAPYHYFGGPLHSAFWREIIHGEPPAPALFNAKKAFLEEFPHGRSHALEVAIELKIYHQYTCLGLGW